MRTASKKSKCRSVWLPSHLVGEIKAFCEQADGNETGGALVGRRIRKSGRVLTVVRALCRPGPNARSTPVQFVPDLDHYRNFLRQMLRRYGFELLGEWHKHPGDFSTPSVTDVDCAREILTGEGHDSYLCLIANQLDNDGMIGLRCNEINNRSRRFIERPIQFTDLLAIPDQPFVPQSLVVTIETAQNFWKEQQTLKLVDVTGLDDAAQRTLILPGEQPSGRIVMLRADESRELQVPTEAVRGFVTIRCVDRELNVNGFALNEEGELIERPCRLIDPTEDCQTRNVGVVETHRLAQASVASVGVGSVGSLAAVELARAGVGHLTLLDPDRLEPANISRHQCDLRDLGRLKVDALSDRIAAINPACQVVRYPVDVLEQTGALRHALTNADVVMVLTDTASSRAMVN